MAADDAQIRGVRVALTDRNVHRASFDCKSRIRYLCGHGRALRVEFDDIVGGMEVSAAFEARSEEEDPSEGAVDGCEDAIGLRCSGEPFVGP